MRFLASVTAPVAGLMEKRSAPCCCEARLYCTVLYYTALYCTCCEARLYTSEALRPRSWSQAATGPGNTASWAGGGGENSGEARGSTASYLQRRVMQWAW